MALVEVIPGVHLVGSGWLGASISDEHDCHVFLVDDGNDAFLVDAGCGLHTERLLGNIDRTGVPRSRIGRVLLTHAHPDHAAGAASLAAALDAEIWASSSVADIVRTADEDASGLAQARVDGLYPAAVQLVATPVARVLTDETFRAAGRSVEAISTPGHAAGHLCFNFDYRHRRVLFSGDLVFARGRVAILDTPDTDVEHLRLSIEEAARRQPDVLLPGHGSLVLDGAHRHVDTAVAAFASGSIPPPLLP